MKTADGRALRIGIIGGGQLGRMLILAGKPLGFHFGILDSDPGAPARALADHFVAGDLYDRSALKSLTDWADVTTFEIEHTDTRELSLLASGGVRIVPAPSLLSVINDKLAQKKALAAGGVPSPGWWPDHPGIYPVVQKLRHGGYDGRGVAILNGPDDPSLEEPSYYEEKVSLRAELAALVARGLTGEIAVYPIVDMEFDPDANLVRRVVIPARVPENVSNLAKDIAVHAVETLDGVGIHAVELFWTQSGEVLVNEIAPRPHNSGHLTIEACETSQYEQHLRAISGYPLGSTRLRSPAVSLNLLGAPGSHGQPSLHSLSPFMGLDRVHVHWYGKSQVRPFRKMGHVTMTGETTEALIDAADALDELAWVGGVAQ